MNKPKWKTPVRRRFENTHSFLGSSAPGGRAVLGAMFRCAGKDTCCQLVIHDSNCEFTSLTLHVRRRDDVTSSIVDPEDLTWLGDVKALVTRVWVWCSLQRGAGAMPESTGRSSVGVERRHPVICLMVSFSVTSNFFTWELLHNAGDEYSAAL